MEKWYLLKRLIQKNKGSLCKNAANLVVDMHRTKWSVLLFLTKKHYCFEKFLKSFDKISR